MCRSWIAVAPPRILLPILAGATPNPAKRLHTERPIESAASQGGRSVGERTSGGIGTCQQIWLFDQ
jgi:hypothetical protein